MTSVNGHRADATTLTGVSETALLTLRARANEARRPDAVIDDPVAIKLDEMDSSHQFSWLTVDLPPIIELEPDQAPGLINECARRFPTGQLMFDLPPRWIPALTRHGFRTSPRYRVPPMPFSLSVAEIADLVNTVPGVRAVHDVPLPRGRGPVFDLLLWTLQRLPVFDPVRPALTLFEFG
jgi:O-methyltransferase involved in polyketide biosynthesis